MVLGGCGLSAETAHKCALKMKNDHIYGQGLTSFHEFGGVFSQRSTSLCK
jgi:hypothetical protein